MQRTQEFLRRVTGQASTIRMELDRAATAPMPHANGPVVPPPAPTDRKRSLASLPLFKKASEALGAQIWHVDDDFNPLAPPRPEKDSDSDSEADTDEG